MTSTGCPRIWVIGDLMLDRTVSGSARRLSPEAPVPVIDSVVTTEAPGGAANLARNLIAQGVEVAVAGAVGDDAAGAALRALLGAEAIGTAGVLMLRRARTTVKLRAFADGHYLLRIDDEEMVALGQSDLDGVFAGLCADLPQPDAVVVSDYSKGMVGRKALASLRAAVPEDTPIFADPKGSDLSHFRGVTLISPNIREVALASGMLVDDDSSLAKAVGVLHITLPGTDILVTRGAAGMTLFPATGPALNVTTVRQQAFDVTGAGDTALAALVASRLRGLEWPEAMALANLAAGVAVSRVGTVVVSAADVREARRQRVAGSGTRAPILSRSELAVLGAEARAKGQKLVFTNGCFDLLHPGHVSLLSEARAMGDLLVVALNDDNSVRRLKGSNRPVLDAVGRAAVLSSLKPVDAVTVFPEDTPLETILACRPAVLVKGADYTVEDVVGHDEIASWGGVIVTVPLVGGRSTSALVARAEAGAGGVSYG